LHVAVIAAGISDFFASHHLRFSAETVGAFAPKAEKFE
jgi:hypothetical protein